VKPITLPCFVHVEGGLKRLELDWEADFDDLTYRVSNIVEEPTWSLKLAYSYSTMKRGERRFVTDQTEFEAMVQEVSDYYDQRIDVLRSERIKNAISAQKAKAGGRVHAPKATKQVPDPDLTIYNTSTPVDKALGAKV
jgi:hypothetical protein